TGQVSPSSVKGMKTKSTPHGSVENPINPIPMAIVGGATYVARAFSGKQKHMVEMLKGALQQGQHLSMVQSASKNSRGTRPRSDRSASGDRARFSVGRRNSDRIVLASDRPAKPGTAGTGVAHRRGPARIPQARRFSRTSETSDPGIIVRWIERSVARC